QSDQACLPCHKEEVNDPAAHSFHEASSEGSRCISCHMPRTEFARMIRHDHSMLGPTPQASIEFESPNACNICHEDQSAEWADEWARKWYGEGYQDKVMHRARLVQSARKGNWEDLDLMLSYITSPERDEVYTASLVRLLAGCMDPRKWPALEEVFRSPSPLIRAAVVDGIVMHPETETVISMLLEAVGSEFRLVRIRAAAVLSDYPLEDMLTEQQQESVENAFRELESSLNSRPDDWSSHYNLGNFFAGRGRFEEALQSYGQATRFRPEEVPVLVNQSMVYARTGDNENAERILRQAVRIEPDNTASCFNLGLLLAEQGKPKEAEYFLREALAADPGMAEAAHNLAVLISRDRMDEAIGMSRLAARENPGNPRYSYTLSFFLHQKGADREAAEILEGLVDREPGFASSYPLLGSLLEASGRYSRARDLYLQALELPGLNPGERNYFSGKAAQMDAMTIDD
ncbi:MAG: tetratricopeptide repeat protein, partial [Acidobacteriota bacterium]